MKILLAIDGSGHSEAAVDEISRQRFPPGSQVRVLSVAASPYYSGTFSDTGMGSVYADLENIARELARAAVEKAATTLRTDERSRHLNVTTAVILGVPKYGILQDAEAFGADLIVVGSHGHGKMERFLLGSVAQAVALHATCSVEIVRRPEASPRSRDTTEK